MGKKKRGHPDVEEVLGRPWCYYCERDFDDLKILINHQKAKHFKCERCGRRLNTAGGLSVHMSQVHKETLSAVDNALPNRAGLDIEIFGMEGIPDDIVQQHTQRVLTNFHQAEAERRAATGNPAPGAAGAGPLAKKPKVESAGDLKARLAAHKAKVAAEQGNGSSSGGGTPLGAGQAPSPAMGTSSTSFAGSAPLPSHQQLFNGGPNTNSFGYSPPYGQAPAPALPFQQQPHPGGFHPQPTFSPPPYQSQSPFPGQPFSPPMMQPNGPPQFQVGSLSGPPRPFGAQSPVQPFQQQQQMPPRIHTPPQNGTFPPRPASVSLPAASGLPQRPAFGAPHVNAFQMQQMHQGQVPGPPNPILSQPPPALETLQQKLPPQKLEPPPRLSQEPANATSLDDLISGASKQAEVTAPTPAPVQTEPAVTSIGTELGDEKTSKKEKDKSKATKLVYSDNEISPEEKMARMPRYAFTPEKKAVIV